MLCLNYSEYRFFIQSLRYNFWHAILQDRLSTSCQYQYKFESVAFFSIVCFQKKKKKKDIESKLKERFGYSKYILNKKKYERTCEQILMTENVKTAYYVHLQNM